jgi:hypothetical protein
MYNKKLPKVFPEPEISSDIYQNDIIELLAACYNWCENGIELANESFDETEDQATQHEIRRYKTKLMAARKLIGNALGILEAEFLNITIKEELEREVRCCLAL